MEKDIDPEKVTILIADDYPTLIDRLVYKIFSKPGNKELFEKYPEEMQRIEIKRALSLEEARRTISEERKEIDICFTDTNFGGDEDTLNEDGLEIARIFGRPEVTIGMSSDESMKIKWEELGITFVPKVEIYGNEEINLPYDSQLPKPMVRLIREAIERKLKPAMKEQEG